MSERRTYLDYNATAPLCAEARAAMIAALDEPGNASSVHADGRKARSIIEAARQHVAHLLNAKPSEVVFTSGATESNTWALTAGWDTIFVAGSEHISVLAAAAASGARVITLSIDGAGRVAPEALGAALADAAPFGRALLSVQIANNETGVVQDVAALAGIAHAAGVSVHTDAVQAPGRLAIDFSALGAGLMSVSAHKIGGPKGVGALVIRDGFNLKPLFAGGGQERRRRGGTENIAAIAGFGAAAGFAQKQLASIAALQAMRDSIETHIRTSTPDAVILAEHAPRLANTTCVAVPGTLAETLVIKFDLAGVSLSAGSACSSGKVGVSHVLSAMQVNPNLASSAVRISVGAGTTKDDIAAFQNAWDFVAARSGKAA